MRNDKDGHGNSFLGHMPCYSGLEWRLDAIVGSRALPFNDTPQVYPVVTLDFKIRHPQEQDNKIFTNLADSQCDIDRHLLLQTDPVNLCHMADVLESALKEARSQRFRKLQRQV